MGAVMVSNAEEISQRERLGWGETRALTEDLRELLKREKWRKNPRPVPRATSVRHAPEVVGDSLDLYSILERTKHGVHP